MENFHHRDKKAVAATGEWLVSLATILRLPAAKADLQRDGKTSSRVTFLVGHAPCRRIPALPGAGGSIQVDLG